METRLGIIRKEMNTFVWLLSASDTAPLLLRYVFGYHTSERPERAARTLF